MAARRRKKPGRSGSSKKLLARRGTVLVFLVLLGAAVFYGLVRGLQYTGSLFLSRNPRFQMKQLDLSSDGRLSSTQLREYAAIPQGINLFAVDFDALRETLYQVPLVESVRIRRRLPDTLVVRVSERTAAAQIRWKRRVMPLLIDTHGVVLPATRSGTALPLIDGLQMERLQPGDRVDHPGVRYCLALLAAAEQLNLGTQIRVNSFDLRYPDFITVEVNGETSARFPTHSPREKLIRLVSVLQLSQERGERVRTVDLTPDGRNVPVTFY